MTDLAALLANFDANPPATEFQVAACEVWLGRPLPADYRRFLLKANGGEGPIGPASYVALYRCDELQEQDEGYAVDEFLPGFLLIGSNRGGEAFAFDLRTSPWKVVMVPFIGMEEAHARVLAPNFGEFLEALYRER